MDITILKKIGAALLEEIPTMSAQTQEALTKGAAGDWTFPVDKRAEDIVLEGLEASGEPLSVYSEEAGLVEFKGGGTKVIVDPIDGSKNAISGLPYYCTSIAVADADTVGDIVLGYVLNLCSGEEFHAQKGGGAFLNDMAPVNQQLATQQDEKLRSVLCEAQTPGRHFPAMMPLLTKTGRVRCMGAIALDLCYLARGAASVFVAPFKSRTLDFAAGWLIVKEAGGVFTDIEGKDIGNIALGLGRATTILAAGNSALHEKARLLLSEIPPEN